MSIQPSSDMIGREAEWRRLTDFAMSSEPGASLGMVWGRRRIGKSFLLQDLCTQLGGFYHHALRGSSAEALRDLGDQLGRHLGVGAPLSLGGWEDAVEALLALGREREALVVLDEFPYLLEHSPAIASLIQRAYGPRTDARTGSRARLVLCGSAVSVMGELLSGTAPLRGRAGLALRLQPFDFRVARRLHGAEDLVAAVEIFAVIGGVAAYAREMVEHDLPTSREDFDRWVSRRVLSPAAPLFGEIELLLAEDPAVSRARKPNLYHATLSGVALGRHAWSSLASYVKIPGSTLNSIVRVLTAADLVDEVADPLRENRPTYEPSDPFLRFHYAVIRRHQSRLGRHSADTEVRWRELVPTFRSQVLGPCFEAMARFWVRHFAATETLGGTPDHVGRTTVPVPVPDEDGSGGGIEWREIDVVVAADDGATPGERTVLALGEAKVGERLTMRHLRRLEEARLALGFRARDARLLLFGASFDDAVRAAAVDRSELELVDLERLYEGD
jgi:uncharacterized protein